MSNFSVGRRSHHVRMMRNRNPVRLIFHEREKEGETPYMDKTRTGRGGGGGTPGSVGGEKIFPLMTPTLQSIFINYVRPRNEEVRVLRISLLTL